MLYVMLVVCGQVMALIRPKKHSIHPAGSLLCSYFVTIVDITTDIHIILNTIHAPSIYTSPAPASWVPICLPKYNPQHFAHAYISFLCRQEDRGPADQPTAPVTEPYIPDESRDQMLEADNNRVARKVELPVPNVVLVCISLGADMDSVRGWSNAASQVSNVFH